VLLEDNGPHRVVALASAATRPQAGDPVTWFGADGG